MVDTVEIYEKQKLLKPLQGVMLLLRQLNMIILELSPEAVSLAFLCLENKAEPSQELKELPIEAWEELSFLLAELQYEKKNSTIN
jgi:hypothetical protein